MYKSYFREEIEDEKELRSIADQIIKQLPSLLYKYIKSENIELPSESNKQTFLFEGNIVNFKIKSNNKKFLQWLKKEKLKIYLILDFKKRTVYAGYNDKEKALLIFIPKSIAQKILGINRRKDFIEEVSKIFSRAYGEYQSGILHELVHVFDDFQSNGKAFGSIHSSETDFDNYVKSDHEVNARYNQFIDSIIIEMNQYNSIKSFEWLVSKIKRDENFRFDKITDKQQRRIIKRLQGFHQDYYSN